MIAYFDTSALVPLIVDEAGSPAAHRLWQSASQAVSVRIVYAELRASVASAVRAGRIKRSDLDSTRIAIDRLYERLHVLQVDDRLVRRAGGLAEHLELRGYDAVHLAGAERIAAADTVLVAGDAALLTAARRLGIAVADTGNPAG